MIVWHNIGTVLTKKTEIQTNGPLCESIGSICEIRGGFFASSNFTPFFVNQVSC